MTTSVTPPPETDVCAAVAEPGPARNCTQRSSSSPGQGVHPRCARSALADSPGLVGIETSGADEDWRGLNDRGHARRIDRMKRKVMAAGDVHRATAEREMLVAWLITLTYAPGRRWRARHVSDYLRELREWRRDLRYLWVAELQTKRMARSGESAAECLHYHLVVWLPRGVRPPKPDASGMWPHGLTQREIARQPIGYLMKYCSKGSSNDTLPRGARLCGAGGLERGGRLVVRWWLLPRYVRDQCEALDNVHRRRGGGWVSHSTGQYWPPWTPPGPSRPSSDERA